MSIIKLKKRPLLLRGAKIDVIGDEKRLVVMNLETVDHKNVIIGVPPEVAVAMLEDLSVSTLGVVKKKGEENNVMYG